MFTFSVVSLVALSITRGLTGFLMPFYLQEILKVSPSLMGLMFLVPPILTVTLAPVGGHIADKIGPRVPASIGVVVSLAALVIGASLRVDSHWSLPVLAIGCVGLGSAFFNAANATAIIGSVPHQDRGFATGIINAGFELGHLFGISTAGLVMALAFEHYSGMPGVPSAQNPVAFVFSMNAAYVAASLIGSVSLATSVMRGSGKIQLRHEG
jgi:MFS family permease